jgi:hypothetical protein
MDTPALGGDQALVGTSANPISHPLRQGVLIRRRPPAVPLEPVMGGLDGFPCTGLI